MEERHAFAPAHVFAEVVIGRGTCAPDLTQLLAVLAARQFVLPTVQAMRVGTTAITPADRMVRMFATGEPAARMGVGGAFNLGTAQYLSGTPNNEAAVYRGA